MAMAYRDPSGDVVKKFLADNKVRSGWKNLISGDDDVKHYLRQIILDLGLLKGERNWPYAPKSHQILRAFALCEPENVKVIIVGTSPITGEGVANGLAFSSNRMEDQFTENQAIFKVHKVLKEAGILDEHYDYDCGHEEWARNGVLLLNAALTMNVDTKGYQEVRSMKGHCREWRPFLVGLLKTWIKKNKPKQKIFVMLWGYKDTQYEDSKNYADEVWNGIDNVPCNFIVREAHHPTFPVDQSINNFITEAPRHFREIKDSHVEYMNVFKINIRCLRIVNTFLKKNEVKDEWKRLIFSNNDLQVSLMSIIIQLQLGDNDANNNLVPRRDQILRALTFCDPNNVKVIIIGASYSMANGLAFSADAKESDLSEDTASYILRVHDALREAGILDDQYDYHCGHEEWAEKGVLLLNAALTMELNHSLSEEILKKHCVIWRPFLVRLLKAWIEEADLQEKIFVMLWGHECTLGDVHADNYSREIWDEITDVPRNFVVRDAHHPTCTGRDNDFLEMAPQYFSDIDEHYDDVFETDYA